MPILYHPALGRTHDFPSDRSADVARRSGWTDPPMSHDFTDAFDSDGSSWDAAEDVTEDTYTEDE